MLNSVLIHNSTPDTVATDILEKILPLIQQFILSLSPVVKEVEELLTKQEAAKFLKVSHVTLDKLIKEGLLPAYRIGDTIRIKKSEIINSLIPIRNQKYSRRIIENSS